MAVLCISDYSGFHERMSRMRKQDIGLDGVICAKGGEVRVHLPYVASCNPTLFKRITALIQNNKTELSLRETPLAGVQKVVDFFYSGKIEVTVDAFPDILQAAMAMECLDIVKFCVNFVNDTNKNLWSHFLKVAFKYPLVSQPEEFIPNLLLRNATIIPREMFMSHLDTAYLSLVLEKGIVPEEGREYCLSLFLDMILGAEKNMDQHKTTLVLMRDISEQDDELNIENDHDSDDVLSVLKMSLTIDFPGAVQACCEFLKRQPTNSDILTKVVDWIPNNTGTLNVEFLIEYGLNAFADLPPDVPVDTLCAMVSADWLELPEMDILKKCLLWLRDTNAGDSVKTRVLLHVRYGLMSKSELEKIIQGQWEETEFVCLLIMKAMRYHLCPFSQPLLDEKLSKPRLAAPMICMIGNGSSAKRQIFSSYVKQKMLMDIVLHDCEVPTNMINTEHTAACRLQSFIFISGGHCEDEDKTTLNNLMRYDCHSGSWLALSPMASCRCRHTITAVGSILLVVGGRDERDENVHDTTEIYDIAIDSWQAAEQLPVTINQHAACLVGENVYLSGGSGTGNNKQLLCLPEPTGEGVWESKAPMLHGRQCHAMVTYGDMLIVCGGAVFQGTQWSHPTAVECYDTKLNQWTEMSSKPLVPFIWPSADVFHGELFIFGGASVNEDKTAFGYFDDIQRYDITRDEWQLSEKKLPTKKLLMAGYLIF